jgi:hypothetical protein
MSSIQSRDAQLQLLLVKKATVEDTMKAKFAEARSKGKENPSVRFLSRDLRKIKAAIARLS